MVAVIMFVFFISILRYAPRRGLVGCLEFNELVVGDENCWAVGTPPVLGLGAAGGTVKMAIGLAIAGDACGSNFPDIIVVGNQLVICVSGDWHFYSPVRCFDELNYTDSDNGVKGYLYNLQ